MVKLRVQEFDWDAGNKTKCQKHGLLITKIEAFLRHGQYRLLPDVKHSIGEKRLMAVGKSENGRWMFVVFVLRDSLVRPISARYMHEKEIIIYEKEDAAL